MNGFWTFFLALAFGIIPAIFWVVFWLREDRKNPEPRGLIVGSFVAGMVAVLLVIPLEQFVHNNLIANTTLLFLSWAFLEEMLKFIAAYCIALRTKENNEPIDALIYMMTVAFGFAALENTLFLFQPIFDGDLWTTIITGNLRFVGASLLHAVSSASIGATWALSFYKSPRTKTLYILLGLLFAVTLHAAFNLLIIGSNELHLLVTFSFVWVAVVILIAFFEKIKNI